MLRITILLFKKAFCWRRANGSPRFRCLHAPYAWLKIDLKKLEKYLLESNVKISQAVAKILGLDNVSIKNQIKKTKVSKKPNETGYINN